ncbi:hypothetical protein BC332_24955 [Capsicum chinense]|nr:hypothetical protein BC332_24955 [Capsicum chinense]
MTIDEKLCSEGFLVSISKKKRWCEACSLFHIIYQSQVSIRGPVGYEPITLPLRHSDVLFFD